MAAAQSVLQRTELLGSVTLKALETTTQPEKAARQVSASAETMSREALLETGEAIAVGGTSLRHVYETNLISERGMRRVVAEYYRGGDVRKALADEMLIKELGYERDPYLRDHQLKARSQSGGGDGGGTLQGQSVGVQDSSALAIKAGLKSQSATSKPAARRPAQPVLIAANVVAVVVLAILIIVLLLTRL